jgi:hypothetical protein
VFRAHPGGWSETLVCSEALVQGAVVGVSCFEVAGSGSGAGSTALPLLELDDENDPVMQARTASGGGSATLPVTLPLSTVNAGRHSGPTDPAS